MLNEKLGFVTLVIKRIKDRMKEGQNCANKRCTSFGEKVCVVMMKSGAMQAWPLLQPHLPATILLAAIFVDRKTVKKHNRR